MNINEGLSDILYHFTKLSNLMSILRQNAFHASTNIGMSTDLEKSAGRFFFFSTTRSRGSSGSGAGFGSGARSVKIVLDGRKLGQRYKGVAVDYWNYSSKESDYANMNDYIGTMKGKEMEDRIVTDRPTIPNASKYILAIHIFHHRDHLLDRGILDELMGYGKQYGFPIYFYTDDKYYYAQDTRNAVDPYSTYKLSEMLIRILSFLVYDDDVNKAKILNYFKFDEDQIAKLEKQVSSDYYLYFRYADSSSIRVYAKYFMNWVKNMSREVDPEYKFVTKMVADDLRKYGAKNALEYIQNKLKIKDMNENITNKLINKAHRLYEDVEDIPYAEEIPADDNMYEFGTALYDKTQNILNTVGAKIMNNLTMIEIGANIEQYRGILGRLGVFRDELSQGMDRIYDYVESAGYGSDDSRVKKLDAIYDELNDDYVILGDIRDVLDTMVYTADSLNRNYNKAFKLGVKNIKTDISLGEGSSYRKGQGFDQVDSHGRGLHRVRNKEMNNDVYKLRRSVMDYIYRAKELVGGKLPRITVRIVDITLHDLMAKDDDPGKESSILGYGRAVSNEIWIPEKTIVAHYNTHQIVFHEILHAIGVAHNENSPLMKQFYTTSLPSEVIDELFVSHYNVKDAAKWDKLYAKKFANR